MFLNLFLNVWTPWASTRSYRAFQIFDEIYNRFRQKNTQIFFCDVDSKSPGHRRSRFASQKKICEFLTKSIVDFINFFSAGPIFFKLGGYCGWVKSLSSPEFDEDQISRSWDRENPQNMIIEKYVKTWWKKPFVKDSKIFQMQNRKRNLKNFCVKNDRRILSKSGINLKGK